MCHKILKPAFVILAACARQTLGPTVPTPAAMNHLLLGKSALLSVRGRRSGPPPGAVPPPANIALTSAHKPHRGSQQLHITAQGTVRQHNRLHSWYRFYHYKIISGHSFRFYCVKCVTDLSSSNLSTHTAGQPHNPMVVKVRFMINFYAKQAMIIMTCINFNEHTLLTYSEYI
jgi:hypothetical protein